MKYTAMRIWPGRSNLSPPHQVEKSAVGRTLPTYPVALAIGMTIAMMTPDQTLARVAGVLRHTVGPAVGDEVARTQVYMAAVVLEKVAAQVRSADERRRADAEEGAALVRDLREILSAHASPSLRVALDISGGASDRELGSVVGALYAERTALGAELFALMLGRVRTTLRSRLDRELEYSA